MKKLDRTRQSLSSRRAQSNGGFSLIELSIVLTIIGLMIVPLVKGYDYYQAKKRLDDTRANILFLNAAMVNFFAEHGRYPCPSDRSLAFEDPDHGEEQCTGDGVSGNFVTMAVGSCLGERDRGFCKAAGHGGQPIYIGGVPYVTLDMIGSTVRGSQTVDGWKNSLTYAVTGRLTRVADFDDSAGAIEVVDEHGNPLREPPIPTGSIVYAHGVIVSSGPDGLGAFTTYGVENACPIGALQDENCDNDGTFMSSIRYEAPGPDYYDDYTVMGRWSSASIWAYSPIDTDNVYSTVAGNIGVGTDNPQQKLDVAGNIRAEDIYSLQVCNTGGTDCFPSATIGGAGISCGANEVLVGIRNNAPVCRLSRYNVQSITCTGGQAVVSIVNGVPTCGTIQ